MDKQEKQDKLLYRNTASVKAGEIQRFTIRYTPDARDEEEIIAKRSLWVKVKNKELIALRMAYLAGPYVLYVDCKSEDYDSRKKCFVTADQPSFEPQLLPGQSFYAELSCHTIKSSYTWQVDVISQILFNRTIDVDFEITIGTSKKILHESSSSEQSVPNNRGLGLFVPASILTVNHQDTNDLWALPLPDPEKPVHLVILTHGLHSNVSADLFYLKEQIDSVQGENIVVKGYLGNMCKTERGIKYLGSRVAEYIIDLVTNNENLNRGKVSKISFIGHSLGGLVQAFAIAYLQYNFPWFFKNVQPINFITLASPLLGVVHENPLYVNLALLAGVVGKSGQDLSLKYTEKNSQPLLLLLPSGPTHQILKRFERRTVYANISNDGIVPLRTSALLYLDYKGLSQIMNSEDLKQDNQASAKIPNSDALMVNKMPHRPNTDDSYLPQPVRAMMSYFMPQKQRRRSETKYEKFQTNSSNPANDEEDNGNWQDTAIGNLPKASFVETATTLILPPLPSMKYITDPSVRDNVIIHDKVYHERDLPPKTVEDALDDQHAKCHLKKMSKTAKESNAQKANGGSLRKKILGSIDYHNGSLEKLEEEIAREYHKNMSWRKVLVRIKPDAHNNIIVRRRFANAYGWPVIDHLVKNHFGSEASGEEDTVSNGNSRAISVVDSLDTNGDLSDILSRDLLSQENEMIDRQNEEDGTQNEDYEHSWINSPDNAESMFSVGPTGLLSDVSEMMGNLRDQWYNYGQQNKDPYGKYSLIGENTDGGTFVENGDGSEIDRNEEKANALVVGRFI